MIGENHYLIFGGLVCKGQYHKTNVTKNLGISSYTYSTLYPIDLLRHHNMISSVSYLSSQRIENIEESDSTPKYLFL